MSLFNQYQHLIKSKELQADEAQIHAIKKLDLLSEALNSRLNSAENSTIHQTNTFGLLQYVAKKVEPIQGLYFHGRVGRGKTMLMDMFYQQLNITRKKRVHFHHFMETVHSELITLSGLDDPLERIAQQWSSEVDLFCFDEFYVNDIADAMLLAGLLDALLKRGIILICTSNCAPEQLYRNGLQRERFLPTIDIIKSYCQVVSIDGPKDHRISEPVLDGTYNAGYRDYCYDEQQSQDFLIQHFSELARGVIHNNVAKSVLSRPIPCIAYAENIIWFDFMALCSGPRSQRDYIKLADEFSIVIVSNVPQFSGQLIPAVFSGVEDRYQRSGVVMGELQTLDDEARRFIALVDEFYDRSIRLIVSAVVDIDELYQGKQLAFEFSRCRSRLHEMQRLAYPNALV